MEYKTQSKESKIICSNPLRSPSSISSISSTNAHQCLYNFLLAFSFGWLAHFHSWEFLFPRFFLSARIPPCLTLEDTSFFSLCLQLFHTPLKDGSPSFRGKHSKNWSGGREQRDCPSLDLVRKTIKSRRTNLAKPAYHRRNCQQRSNSGAIRPGRVAYCEPGMARKWNDQG